MVDCQEFIDEGYGRDNLVRPGLDRLRDMVAQGDFARVYVQCPDRLGSGAKLVLLVEEFQEQSAEVIFLNGSVEDTPEGKLRKTGRKPRPQEEWIIIPAPVIVDEETWD